MSPVHLTKTLNGSLETQQNGDTERENLKSAVSVTSAPITFGSRPITIEDVVNISKREATVQLSHEEGFLKKSTWVQ